MFFGDKYISHIIEYMILLAVEIFRRFTVKIVKQNESNPYLLQVSLLNFITYQLGIFAFF